jgi:phosphopantothenoylcysteine decarboxylase/phosphopantothenate--cysteine ligase
MDHIRLSRENDLIAVVPASANFLSKMVHGAADDLASALILASDKPVVVAPAMNVKMWEHPATQRNVRQLKKDGVAFVGPAKGALACGEEGEGRMVEPAGIANEIEKFLIGGGNRRNSDLPLAGRKALVTSGPTREGIDPVRYLSNYSSGKQGHAIAEALRDAGASVTLVSGPTNLPDPEGVRIVHVESAREMLDAAMASLPADVAVCTAAVADWTVAHFSEEKIKKSGGGEDFTLVFAENPDILMELGKHKKHRPKLVIGFAAESEHVVENARVKLERKGCDWILANDISGRKVFSSNENTVHLVTHEAQEDWPKLTKQEVGERLAAKVAEYFAGREPSKLRVIG